MQSTLLRFTLRQVKLLKSGTGIEFKSMMAGTVSLGPSTKPDIKQCVYLKYQLDEWMDEQNVVRPHSGSHTLKKGREF